MRMIGLKKIGNYGFEVKELKSFIDKKDKKYSVRKQCKVLGINRAALYYEPREISRRDREMMNLMDEEYTNRPFYGARRMKQFLKRKDMRLAGCMWRH